MSLSIRLPSVEGTVREYELVSTGSAARTGPPPRERVAYAAAHVVADPFAENVPGSAAVLDWEATLAFRRHLWSCGLGVAEAMDTAQRGMGLDWATTSELIRRSAAEARSVGGLVVCGAGTDHAPAELGTLQGVVDAYCEQLEVVESSGARAVIMASRQLAALANDAADYAKVYDRILGQVREKVILHWLGEAFDPALAGYWGDSDPWRAAENVLAVIAANATSIDGIKVSVLDKDLEVWLRRRLPAGVRLYTGDDFHYPELIKGDAEGHSDALLGIFAAIAGVAGDALRCLDEHRVDEYDALMEPTVTLSRRLFEAPTYYYKAGIAFLAWLSGHQPAFSMVAGLQSARSIPHLAEVFRLADRAGVLPDPELAVERFGHLLAVAGVR
jgi:hypothetical protein